jgi:hypothetical protein
MTFAGFDDGRLFGVVGMALVKPLKFVICRIWHKVPQNTHDAAVARQESKKCLDDNLRRDEVYKRYVEVRCRR